MFWQTDVGPVLQRAEVDRYKIVRNNEEERQGRFEGPQFEDGSRSDAVMGAK